MYSIKDDPILYELMAARIKLCLGKTAFFGRMAIRLKVVDVTGSDWCKTAAVDGNVFYYNREFIKTLSREELVFLWGHETAHCMLGHVGGRRGDRKPDYWNMACDYVINSMLKNAQIGIMPACGLISSKYNDSLTAEQVYELLVESNAEVRGTLDHHMELGKGGAPSKEGDKNGPPHINKKDMQKINMDIQTAMIQAAQSAAGNVPAFAQRLIDKMTEPKIDWRALLTDFLRSAIPYDFTYSKLSRRGNGDMIMPANDVAEVVEAVVAVDTSGSTHHMLADFFSEIKGIMQTFSAFKLTLFHFDTDVAGLKEFTPQNIHELSTYPIERCGGTDFACVWNYMKDNDITPNRLVMFTDGEPYGSWGDPDYCDTLFIVHSTKKTAPFGMTVHYSPHEGVTN